MIRIIKSVLALFVGLLCIIYALQNVFNLGGAFWFVETMASMSGHESYPNHLGPPVTAPGLVWAILWIIILSELAAGSFAIKGFIDMWGARNADADTFNRAKTFAIIGSLLGVVIWFGYFHAIGGAYFQMWQTPAGSQALQGAFQYSMLCGLIAVLLAQKVD